MDHHANIIRRGRGFTLIEIMVVVIVLAVIAGAIAPNLFSAAASVRLDASARRLAALMDYCYQSANATGRVHGLIFSEDGKSFQVGAEPVPDPENPDPIDDEEEGALVPQTLPGLMGENFPEDIELDHVSLFDSSLAIDELNRIRILFFPDGVTEFATITLTDSRGEQRMVDLNGLSGTITISDPALDALDSGEESAQ